MAEKRLLKELKALSKEKNPLILSLAPDNEDMLSWSATVTKPKVEDSIYYYNGQWDLEIKVPSTYPMKPPVIKFSRRTPIAHPNIDLNTGEICLDILKDGWSPAWNIHYLVVAILMLIDDPEPDSPLNIDMANLWRSDKVAYESVVQYVMWKHGTFHGGKKYPGGLKEVDESCLNAHEARNDKSDLDSDSDSDPNQGSD